MDMLFGDQLVPQDPKGATAAMATFEEKHDILEEVEHQAEPVVKV